MTRIVIAREVIETNDISGRKHVDVVARADDEIVEAHYQLTPRYMIPYEKLMLATVSPEDEIFVEINSTGDPFDFIKGEYVGNHFDAHNRDPLCKCGSVLTSDGIDLYCPNRECGLTILARLNRLASCRFFNNAQWSFSFDAMSIDSGEFKEQPFAIILNAKTWNRKGWDIERIILDSSIQHVSLATFLVQDQFRAFIDANGSYLDGYDPESKSLHKFYEMMDQIIYKRDYDSIIQHNFIKNLLWSFSIPGLNEDIINQLIVAEHSMGLIDEVLLPYASYLSDSRAMQDDLGVDRLTADWISREFFIRRHEFFDIFTAYSLTTDIVQIFNNLNQAKRNLDEVFKLNIPGVIE